MIETTRTRVGRLVVDTSGDSIKFVSKFDGLKADQTHTHYLTVEQCHVLMHSLARAINMQIAEVQK